MGLDHRRIHPKTPPFHNAFFLSDAHKPLMDLLDRVSPERHAPWSHRFGIGQLVRAHMSEVAIDEVGTNLAFQNLVAPIAHVLEDQKPQYSLGCNALPPPTAALGMTLRQCLIYRADNLLVRQHVIGMLHPGFAKVAHFPGDQPIAKAVL